MVRVSFLDVRNCTSEDLFQHLHILIDRNLSILQTCESQNIFHKFMKPVRILINVRCQFPSRIPLLGHIHDHFGCTHNSHKRCPQIMRNGSQQICPILLLLHLFAFLINLRGIFPGPQCKGRAENRGRKHTEKCYKIITVVH